MNTSSSHPPSSHSSNKEPEKPETPVTSESEGWFSWFNHWWRCACFFLIEGGFIALAIFLHFERLPLPFPSTYSRFDTTVVKSATGTAFLLWHTSAQIIIGGVVADAFSREWSVSKKTPVDRVSTITSGTLDQVFHLPYSSTTFKLALVASTCMFILLRVGPASIVVENGFLNRNVTVGGLILGTSDMSHAAVKVEQVLNLNIGYVTEPRIIIPKPAYNASGNGGLLHYDSDIVIFKHKCQWYAPTFNGTTAVIGGENFEFRKKYDIPPRSSSTWGTGIFALNQATPATDHSAFLVFGGNSSLALDSDTFSFDNSTESINGRRPTANTIDLSDLPTSYNASWYNFSSSRFTVDGGNPLIFRAPLSAALLCVANANLTTGTVWLSSNSLSVNRTGIPPRVGNILTNDTSMFFSWASDGVGDPRETVMTLAPSLDPNAPQTSSDFQRPFIADFTPLAAHLILPRTDVGAWPNAQLAPLPLDQIEHNIDALILSASKVQVVEAPELQGVAKQDLLASSGPRELPAMEQGLNQVLASNLLWLVLTGVTALATFVLCLDLARRIDEEGRPTFTLKNIENIKKTELS